MNRTAWWVEHLPIIGCAGALLLAFAAAALLVVGLAKVVF